MVGGSPRADDARSEVSFQSADDDDDFDLPQDLGEAHDDAEAEAAAPPQEGGALPPGLNASSDDAGNERWNLRKDGNKEQLEPIWVRLSGEREHVKISKMFSYVLRHAAHKLDVRIRKDGFVRLREIMKLRNFKPYNLEELMAVIYFDEKERYTMVREYDGELLVRANQGHTMKVVESDLLLETITDPSMVTECVHGTYLVHWPFIKRQGLSKVARNHIHLANGLPEDGKIRGMRSTAELFVYVDVPRAMEDGVIFYRSKNDVILTQGLEGWLPPKYFQKAVRIDYNTCDIEELAFDVDVEIPTWAAELAPSGPGEQGTYLIKNLEALISNCRKRLQDVLELKAMSESGRELDDDENHRLSMHAMVYTELQSLEQRFRQHKGYRRETAQEKEMRAKDEAEAGTVVKKKDRALTPPWERGKSHLESGGMKATEKEKAEWAALGRRRDTATTNPAPKKPDPWAALGRGRQSAGAATPLADTPSASAKGRGGPGRGDSQRFGREDSQRFGREDSQRFGREDSQRLGREDSQRLGREGSWRFGREDSKQFGRQDSKRLEDTSVRSSGTASGPPRFFNSKKSSEGSSWRDRMSQTQHEEEEEEEPPWREQMQQPRSAQPSQPMPPSPHPAPLHYAPASMPGQMAGFPPPAGGSRQTAPGMMGEGCMAPAPMWPASPVQGGQMYGYGAQGQSQLYYMPSAHGPDSAPLVPPGGWVGQPQYQPRQEQAPSPMTFAGGGQSNPGLQQGFRGQPAFNGQPGFAGQQGCGGHQGFARPQGYAGPPGYGGQADFGGQRGFAAPRGFAAQQGVGPDFAGHGGVGGGSPLGHQHLGNPGAGDGSPLGHQHLGNAGAGGGSPLGHQHFGNAGAGGGSPLGHQHFGNAGAGAASPLYHQHFGNAGAGGGSPLGHQHGALGFQDGGGVVKEGWQTTAGMGPPPHVAGSRGFVHTGPAQ